MLNRHLLAYLPVYFAQALVGFGSVAVFTRLLTPEEYGRYMLLLTAAALAGTIVFTWLDAAVARHHARSDARRRLGGHLFTAWRIFAILAVLALIIGGTAVAVVPMPEAWRSAAAFALAHTLVRSGLTLVYETRRAAGQSWRYSLLETFTLSAGFALGVAFILAGGLGAAGPFAGMALAGALALAIDAPVLLSRARRDRADGARALAFLSYGGPVAVSLVFELMLSAGDRILIAALLGEAATGAYAAGYAVADRTLTIVFLWLGATTGPLLVRALEHEGREAARDVAHRTAGLMALLGLPVAAGLALVAEPAARLLIGADLADSAARIIPFIALAGLMNGVMTHYFHEAYVLGRRPRAMAGVMAGAALLNLGLNLVLIPRFGLTGAAVATVIAYAAALTASILHGRRVFALPIPVRTCIGATLATVLMGAGVLALPDSDQLAVDLAFRVAAGAAIYVSAALALDVAGCRSWVAACANVAMRRASA